MLKPKFIEAVNLFLRNFPLNNSQLVVGMKSSDLIAVAYFPDQSSHGYMRYDPTRDPKSTINTDMTMRLFVPEDLIFPETPVEVLVHKAIAPEREVKCPNSGHCLKCNVVFKKRSRSII